MLSTPDLLRLIHPVLAIVYVFPLIGIATYFAVQTRQRRLAIASKEPTRINPIAGREHTQVGRWLTGSVVGLVLIGLAHSIFRYVNNADLWATDPFQVGFVVLMFALTIAALVFLYRAQAALWRGIFATLTGMGLVILGCQDGVFRRTYEWYVSHYYLGMAAVLLMVFSLAILPDIYQSRRWRTTHVILNSVALLLFISQAITGVRDLLASSLQG